MPWLSPAAIRVVLDQALSGDIIIPELAGRLQPMHAVYAKTCLPVLHSLLEAGRLKVQDFCVRPELRVHRIPEAAFRDRSEEHTSELQSLAYLVCRLLLEKKKKKQNTQASVEGLHTRRS